MLEQELVVVLEPELGLGLVQVGPLAHPVALGSLYGSMIRASD